MNRFLINKKYVISLVFFIALINVSFASPLDQRISFHMNVDEATVSPSNSSDQVVLGNAAKKENRSEASLKESPPEDIYLGTPVNNSWPDSKNSTKKDVR